MSFHFDCHCVICTCLFYTTLHHYQPFTTDVLTCYSRKKLRFNSNKSDSVGNSSCLQWLTARVYSGAKIILSSIRTVYYLCIFMLKQVIMSVVKATNVKWNCFVTSTTKFCQALICQTLGKNVLDCLHLFNFKP